MTRDQTARLRFLEAAAFCKRDASGGIGTLGEKTLHAVLKHYCQPDGRFHEVKVGRSVADIRDENGITEIQTRSFDRLRPRLERFLPLGRVTVVYPVAHSKFVLWLDPMNGGVTKKRKSPKQGAAWDVLPELYKISAFLQHPNLSLRVVLLDIDEYRLLDGWSDDRKKGSTRYERIPNDWLGEVRIDGVEDWKRLLPPDLPQEFDSARFARCCKRTRRFAQTALRVLNEVGAVERIGKKGNTFIYKIGQ